MRKGHARRYGRRYKNLTLRFLALWRIITFTLSNFNGRHECISDVNRSAGLESRRHMLSQAPPN